VTGQTFGDTRRIPGQRGRQPRPPVHENFGKRLIKSPKLYFCDSGLACHLLGIEPEGMLNRSPFLGPVFEGLVVSEILKRQLNSGKSKQIHYFRDRQGLKVDFLVPAGGARLLLLEAKASRTALPQMAEPLDRLSRAIRGYNAQKLVVYRPSREAALGAGVRPGTRALSLADLLALAW
jgi:predicted AAA+ superfamily ATPase